MADISEVLDAVRDVVSRVLYPNGVPPGSMPASVVGAPVRVYVGWPDASLDSDLQKKICQVSIWPRGQTRIIGPYLDGWQPVPRAPASMSVSTLGNTITFSGTGASRLMIASVVIEKAKSYNIAIPTNATAAQVAQSLADLINADRQATVSGASLTLVDAGFYEVRIVSGGQERKELRRVAEGIQITAWCPTPTLRDKIASLIDQFFEENRSIAMPDGTIVSITYNGSPFDEEARSQPLHRRDLLMTVEYTMVKLRETPGIASTTPRVTRVVGHNSGESYLVYPPDPDDGSALDAQKAANGGGIFFF